MPALNPYPRPIALRIAAASGPRLLHWQQRLHKLAASSVGAARQRLSSLLAQVQTRLNPPAPRTAATLQRRVSRDRNRVNALLAQAFAAQRQGQAQQARQCIAHAHAIAAALIAWELRDGYPRAGLALCGAIVRNQCELPLNGAARP
ncbi:hypothetical protein ABFV80_002323 [Vandammella animalimorsus]|uniref:hypothetical protein n=1 Tax=Vandammella animalimorsus TaxID=2029117 RepID=UPI00325AE3B8